MDFKTSVLIGLLLSAMIVLAENSKFVMNLKFQHYKTLNQTNYEETRELRDGIIAYCKDNNISEVGQPQMSDLINNNYYLRGYKNALDNNITLDWSNSGSNYNHVVVNYSLKQAGKEAQNAILLVKNMKQPSWLAMGTVTCDDNTSSDTYGDCSIDMPIGIECK